MKAIKRFVEAIPSYLRSFSSSILSFLKFMKEKLFIVGKTFLKVLDNQLCSTKYSLFFLMWFSTLINYFLEAALRLNLWEPVLLLFKSPHVFILGVLIVFATLSPLYLFKRRAFYFSLVSALWITITCISLALMFLRTTPFNSSDFKVLKSAIDIIPIYLSIFDMVLIGIAIVIAIIILVQIFRKCNKSKGLKNISSIVPLISCSITIICVICNSIFIVNADRFDNLPNKYREHGFAFCFLYSIIDNGIPMPNDYSHEVFNTMLDKNNANFKSTTPPKLYPALGEQKELINSIYNIVTKSYETMPDYPYLDFSEEQSQETRQHLSQEFTSLMNSLDESDMSSLSFPESFKTPNIIFYQMESFYDVNNIEGYEYSESPHPVYSLLKEKLPGGKLTVPSIGAGTANTEFEIITGMDVSFFGIAEYPYLTILQDHTSESIANNAREYGYTTHAVHNHKGTFYDRNLVFRNLGFDTFSSIETFPKVIKNKRNWAKDASLMLPMLGSLDYSENCDLIYSIGVQPHGRYPSESTYQNLLDGSEPKIKVSGNENNPENPGFTYYVNELNESDVFIGNLILELCFRNEPTVLILYGDHLPAFSVQKNWTLKEGDCYQTDYIIWNNCGIDFSDAKDLKTYQLASYVFSKLGINSGIFNKLNRNNLDKDSGEYRSNRHFFQYATFYDETLAEESPVVKLPAYPVINTKPGVYSAHLTDAHTIVGTTYISGENFNQYTIITINSEEVETEFINSNIISTTEELKPDDVISTVQKSVAHTVISLADNSITYNEQMIVPDDNTQEYLSLLLPFYGDLIDESVDEQILPTSSYAYNNAKP